MPWPLPPTPVERAKGRGASRLLPWELTLWNVLGAQRSLENTFWIQDHIKALGGLTTVGE